MITNETPSKRQKFPTIILPLLLILIIAALIVIGSRREHGKSADNNIQSAEDASQLRHDECEAHRENIEQKLEQDSFHSRRTNMTATQSVKDLFYSPKVDACLYVKTITFFKDTRIQSIAYELVNLKSNVTIHNKWILWDSGDFEAQKQKFADIVKKYQLQAP